MLLREPVRAFNKFHKVYNKMNTCKICSWLFSAMHLLMDMLSTVFSLVKSWVISMQKC